MMLDLSTKMEMELITHSLMMLVMFLTILFLN